MIDFLRSGGIFDFDQKELRLQEILEALNDPSVWEDLEKSQELNKERSRLEKAMNQVTSIEQRLQDSEVLLELSVSEKDEEILLELSNEIKLCEDEISKLEQQRMFSGEMDSSSAFLDIQAGSGGTEAQDWANMLLRMYLRYCDSNNFNAALIESSPGEVAGIKSASINISGNYAYGWMRTETGIHRLVRKSPFDSGSRRHTSFAAVFVSPEIDDEIDIELDMSKVRIDTYRASGAGGQHVNKTDSAVRLTHEPTGLVVQCQSQRSQHQNKDRAIKQLKSKLYELEIQKKEQEIQKLEDSKTDIGWGNQIRSYVLDQSRIKDIRTKHEETNTQAVLDGKINNFIKASLKNGF